MKHLREILSLRNDRELKSDNSFVTKGDLLIQSVIMDFMRIYAPSYVMISEETDLEGFLYDPGKDYVVVDPIDGTENFTSGLKEWGVSVSFYSHDSHVESMLAMPELDVKLISGDQVPKYASRIYGLSSSLSKEYLIGLSPGWEYRIMGCAVYNLLNVIQGSFAVYENPVGANAWDILAGLNLALEHGFKVSVNDGEYHGNFLTPNHKYRFRLSN
jgi:fructose-1,6-bisphosphatase/inositol monophosphatase family enzyme